MPAPVIEDLNGTLEVAIDVGATLGEGPVWDHDTGTLIFVDSAIGRIYRWHPGSTALTAIEAGQEIGAAILRQSEGLVVAGVDGLLAVAADGTRQLLVAVEADRPHYRLNDAKCDSRGRLFTGTFAQPFERGASALYRIDHDLTLSCIVPGVTISNGIAWSPDETIFYYVDTSTRGIDRFDYDIATGAVANRRRFVEIARDNGFPDGLTVDADGFVWLALYLGGEVRRYDPGGRQVARVTLPVSGVTSCTFGGAGLADLYITTARLGVARDKLASEPLAGAVFRCRPGVAGLPSYRFAG